MPPRRRNPTDPSEWLRRARSNLARAKADRGIAEVLYEDLCFDAQQAAEKAIKAVLVHRGVYFPKTHSIADLLTLVDQRSALVPADVRHAVILTEYGVEARYPGLSEDVTEEDYLEAVSLADTVVRWAESLIAAD